jgi:hypothetical protein
VKGPWGLLDGRGCGLWWSKAWVWWNKGRMRSEGRWLASTAVCLLMTLQWCSGLCCCLPCVVANFRRYAVRTSRPQCGLPARPVTTATDC